MTEFERLFVYGTLQDPLIQKRLLGRTLTGTPDQLPDFVKLTDGLPYPVALPQDGDVIEGLLLEVTPRELARLDLYEGDGYVRVLVTLASRSEAWVYMGNMDFDGFND